ncbi:MAG: PAS domain S-box protein [Kiritimatiellaeota bacterium]|nr:PAS domain S-box protein [Kiritimatiellota bacterium]
MPVLSAFAPVPDSPWFLVGKVDEAEALVAWREQSRLIIGLIALLILSMLLAGGGLWQRMQKRHYRTTLRVELERQALRKHFELFIRNANDIIVLSDGERKIIEANERALAAYGYTREEMIGMSVRKLIPDEDVDAFETRMQDLETHGEFRIEGIHLRKDGGRFPVEVSARVIEVEGRKFVQAITRDITERKAHLAEIERMNRLYLALSQVDQSIVRARTREELFAKMCRVLVEFGGFKLVWIGMVNPVTKQVEVAARHGEGQDYLDGIQIFADDRPEGRGPTGLAIRENRPVMANDFARDARTQPWQAAGAQVGIRSSAAFPLLLQQQACGALIVYASEPNFFREREIALLLEASIDISFAMEKLHEAEQHALLDAQLQASEAGLSHS